MKRILLTGATGFVGRALSEKLLESSCGLMVAVRQLSCSFSYGIKQVKIDGLATDTNWSEALTGVDVVIHVAARVHVMNDFANDPLVEFRKVNFEGTMALARQAVQAGVKRFIFISSIKVNGEKTKPGVPFTANDTPNPVDPYGISKAETEQALLKLAESTGLEVVIIRPVLVYGPGVKANFRNLMNYVNKGVPLPLGLIYNKRSLVAIDNLVGLIIMCINHPAAINEIFLVSDDEDLSTTCLLQRVGKALGRPARLLPVPGWLISAFATFTGKRDISQRLLSSLQVDISKTRDLLGWVPPVRVDEALKKTAQAFLEGK